jgi:hypothetical protein
VNIISQNGAGEGTVTLQPKTTSYDSYGQIKALSFPSGYVLSPFVTDVEGNIISDSLSESNVYSTRGELAWQTEPNGGPLGAYQPTQPIPNAANGVICENACAFNPLSGHMLMQQSGSPKSPKYTYTESVLPAEESALTVIDTGLPFSSMKASETMMFPSASIT